MQSRLQQLADIRVGMTMRGRDASRRTAEAGPHLLRIRDLTESGDIAIESPHLIDPGTPGIDKFRLRPGDVVMASRGSRTTAAVAPEGLDALAGGQLFLIRLKSEEIDPRYLRWFLNQPRTQRELAAEMRGSYVQTLASKELGRTEVPVPPLPIQHNITEFKALAEREKSLMDAIREKRGIYRDAAMLRAAQGREPS